MLSIDIVLSVFDVGNLQRESCREKGQGGAKGQVGQRYCESSVNDRGRARSWEILSMVILVTQKALRLQAVMKKLEASNRDPCVEAGGGPVAEAAKMPPRQGLILLWQCDIDARD